MKNKSVNNCVIVIPVYKDGMSAYEEQSLRRCLDVLSKYPIVFVAPRRLNCNVYGKLCSEYQPSASVNYEFFKDKYFKSLNGYNALMLSEHFYRRFLMYDYVLIYQLDAFVFEDNLAYWLAKNYDYVGGPVFDVKRGDIEPRHTMFLNGGFSLRKTSFFCKHSKAMRLNIVRYMLLSKYEILERNKSSLNHYQKIHFLASCSVKYLCKLLQWDIGEDFEWSIYIKKHGNIVPFNEALRFSFDSCPEYAFKLNGDTLPFGCHGWPAYYNRLFWEEFIS